jgi:hypothetical protein
MRLALVWLGSVCVSWLVTIVVAFGIAQTYARLCG